MKYLFEIYMVVFKTVSTATIFTRPRLISDLLIILMQICKILKLFVSEVDLVTVQENAKRVF